MRKKLTLIYGIFNYMLIFAVFLYFIGFVGNIAVPKSIDSGGGAPVLQSVIVDVILLGLFGIQHSLMARASFKKWWTKLIPQPIERSTYVLFTGLILSLVMWQWRPLSDTLWNIQQDWLRFALWGLFGLGWIIVFASANMINGMHLFGVQQVREYAQNERITSPKFKTPGLYRYVRHPLMLGFLIAFWATPEMTIGHLLFSTILTIYIFVGIQFEERSLLRHFADRYREYRQRVPMIIPYPQLNE